MKKATNLLARNLSILALAASLVVGCGDSNFEDISGQPATNTQSVTVAPTGNEIVTDNPDFVSGIEQGPAPGGGAATTATASFTITGGNADMSDFKSPPSSVVQAGLRGIPRQPTGLFFAIQKGAATEPKRVLRLELSGGTSKLAVESRISADSARSGAKATIVYVDQTDLTKPKTFISTGGEVVIKALTANSFAVRLEKVRLAPQPSSTNSATGTPVITGDATFSF